MGHKPQFSQLAALLVAFCALNTIASPLDAAAGIAIRNNKWMLHCSNAPAVIAGE